MEKTTIQSQLEMIVDHMKKYGSISQLEATNLYGIMRLPARIYDLRKRGFSIKAEAESSLNRFKKKSRYARYSIVSDGRTVL